MKLGIFGGSNRARSLPFDAQRTLNLYLVMDEGGQGKEPAALYGTPGLTDFADVGSGPIRAQFTSATGRAFVVSGASLYELFTNGTSTLLGALESGTSICSVAENVTQLGICDGTDLYILTYSTDAFAKVTDGDFPGAGSVTFQDQYFIVNKPGTGEFYISTLGNGLSWASLDFATAESSPDDLVRVYSAYGQVWLMGEITTEVWYNSGDATFPFARVEGAKMQVGCASAHSVIDIDNSLYWLGKDKDGRGIVYMAQGYAAVRVSTHAMEKALRDITDYAAVRAYSYQEEGHLFYALTGGGLATTWVYDVSTKQWHERAYLEPDGSRTAHRAATHMFAFGKHLVGDKELGKVYEQSLDYYDDAGDEIFRQRTFTHLHNEDKRFTVNNLQVDFEPGVGLVTGQGSDPIARLEVSNDGGKTWSPEYFTRIGKIGKFKTRAVWRKLGQFDLLTARVTITDPVKVAITGAYMQ